MVDETTDGGVPEIAPGTEAGFRYCLAGRRAPRARGPKPLAFGGTGSSIHLHVDDVDRLARRAIEAGATMLRAPSDEGHGERQCRIRDPLGHEWLLGHQTESVSSEEIQRRFEAEDQPRVMP